MGVPNAQPPLPTDWEVHPTHPVHRVPYQLAQFWDRGVRQRVEDKTTKLQAIRKRQQLMAGSATGLGVGEVPRDLRETAKRTPAVRSWIRALEEPVRQFLHKEQDRRHEPVQSQRGDGVISTEDDLDSDDEEIVFVGRDGAMRELREKRETRYRLARREVSHETVDSGVVFDSFGEGESAAFKYASSFPPSIFLLKWTRRKLKKKPVTAQDITLTALCRRWLTHSISDYYGLASRSVTLVNTSHRVVYVGLKQARHTGGPLDIRLPRPLWELC